MISVSLRRPLLALGFTFVTINLSAPVLASQAHDHIGHVMSQWQDTPGKQGLLPIALAEAKIAQTHAEYSVSKLDNLGSMQLHARHVLHALDISLEPKGPGKGYGLLKAAQGVATHAELASDAAGATDVVRVSGIMVSSVGRNTVKRAEQAIEIAMNILKAKDAASAAPYALKLQTLTAAFFTGKDLNNDGRIVWYHHEGGLDIATQQMEIIKKSEGL